MSQLLSTCECRRTCHTLVLSYFLPRCQRKRLCLEFINFETQYFVSIDTFMNSRLCLEHVLELGEWAHFLGSTVKILKFGTPQTSAIIVLKLVKFDVTLL